MSAISDRNEIHAREISERSREALIEEFVAKVESGELTFDKRSIMEAIESEVGGKDILDMLGIVSYNLASIVMLQVRINKEKSGNGKDAS